MKHFTWMTVPAAVAIAACDPTPPEEPRPYKFTIGGERPAELTRPYQYVAGTPVPLVIVLHGYGGSSAGIDRYFGISGLLHQDHFAVILPQGTLNPDGRRFWDATDFCCDFREADPDDVGYLNELVEEAADHVEPEGVYLVGLSNGGFMSYRMACESMPKLRGIVNLAGSSFDDADRCEGAEPISILHIHGTVDSTIRYNGGSRNRGTIRYSGAREVVERWASRAGCDIEAGDTLPSLDLVGNIPGAETTPLRYRTGCRTAVTVELWTIQEGPHVPRFDSNDIARRLTGWLFG